MQPATKRVIVAALTVAALAAGCGGQPAQSEAGVVVAKRTEPGHWEAKKICAKKVGGKCRKWTTNPVWDDPEYELLIRSGGSEEWVDVDQDVYDRAQVGGRWDS